MGVVVATGEALFALEADVGAVVCDKAWPNP
jgi:hypothetical protein